MGLLLPSVSVGAGDIPHNTEGTATANIGEQNSIHHNRPVLQFAATTVAANNTTQHENPEEVATQDDAGDISRWLEGRLAGRLSQSTLELSQGEADLAKRLLGEGFTDQFEQYAYVTETTGTNSDDQAVEQFRRTRETQEEFATAVQEYRETREEYEEARQNGNESRARRLARELQRLSRTTNRTGGSLQTDYATLSDQTTTNLAEASLTVQNITQNVTQQQTEIVEETFVRTTLALRPDSRQTSFLDPLQLTGQLTGDDGSALAGRTVRLRIGGQPLTTQTGPDGEFSISYRPTLLDVGQQTVTVRFVPQDESVYLGVNRTVTISVSQITPELSIDRAPDVVAFDDRVEVSGRVSAEDIGARGVPVDIRLGRTKLGTIRTAPDGTYSFSTRIPANVDNGEQTLTTRIPLEGRALAEADQARSVTVNSTPTTITVSGEQVSGKEIRISGVLKTNRSSGISNQSVALSVAGDTIVTAQTGPNGRFSERVSLPADAVPPESNISVAIAAHYDQPSSNLQPSDARATLRLQSLISEGGAGPSNGLTGGSILAIPDGIPVGLMAVVIMGGFLVLIGGSIYLRRDPTDEAAEPNTDDAPTDLRSYEPSESLTEKRSTILEDARTAIDNDRRDRAVKLAYMDLKQSATDSLELPEGTHWEFFVACQETGHLDDKHVETLRRLTETYEQAAFAPRQVSVDDANWVLDAVLSFDIHG